MGALLGLMFGVGVLLIWFAFARPHGARPAARTPRWLLQRSDLLRQAGIDGVGSAQLFGAQFACAVVAGLIVLGLTSTIAIAVCFAGFAFFAPIMVLRRMRRRRQVALRELWPEAVDNLASAVRAGMSLPEALSALALRGPEPLRPPFARFSAAYRASGRFGECLDALKDDLADPVGDRVCETMRVAREVGGSDLGTVLRTLSELLRSDARTRSELETRQGWVINAARLAVAARGSCCFCWAPSRRRCTRTTRPAACCCWRSAPRCASSRTGSCCASAGFPRTSGCCDDRLHEEPGARRAGQARSDSDVPSPGRAEVPMSSAVLGGLLGLLFAVGVIVAVRAAPPMRPIRLAERIAPYLGDTPVPSKLLARPSATSAPFAVARRLFGPVLGELLRFLDRTVGGSASVRRRLGGLGERMTIEEFRFEQVVWAAVGMVGGGLLVTLLGLARGGVDVVLAIIAAIIGLVGGVLARDWWLTRQVERREEAMLSEFPVVADLLALSVVAGEAPTDALQRVCRLTGGELARDLDAALAQARSGTPITTALSELAERSTLEPFSRFVQGLVVAIERGTPLADVLRAQAADVREAGKRALLEAGGRKEISMMVPVVFLILPVTVLFALYPGLITLVSLTH